jgi:hypothetical protein
MRGSSQGHIEPISRMYLIPPYELRAAKFYILFFENCSRDITSTTHSSYCSYSGLPHVLLLVALWAHTEDSFVGDLIDLRLRNYRVRYLSERGSPRSFCWPCTSCFYEVQTLVFWYNTQSPQDIVNSTILGDPRVLSFKVAPLDKEEGGRWFKRWEISEENRLKFISFHFTPHSFQIVTTKTSLPCIRHQESNSTSLKSFTHSKGPLCIWTWMDYT